MAEDNGVHRGPACRCAQDEIFTLFGRISPIWKHFRYKKDSTGNLVKAPRAHCKLCFQSVAHGDGTTNLRSHLHLNHLAEYSNLFPDEKANKNKQPKIEEFTLPAATVARLSASSQVLTEAVIDFIVRYMRPLNTVDGEGFMKIFHRYKFLIN